MRNVAVWYIKDIVTVLRARQDNEFDGNFGVSGDRGNGKSTLINKIFYRMGGFKPRKHQVYSGDDVKRLLMTQVKGKCFDDEAINSGYKRNFQDKGQQELIKILTNYRDRFNIHASAIPNFFSLDKDLRDLIFLHIHVIERGMAVVHLPLQSRLYLQDRWDSKNNAKVEMAWSGRIKRNPNFKIPFHKLSTFAGYLYFSDLTPNQKKLYLEVKSEKRANVYETDIAQTEGNFYNKLYELVIAKKITKDGLFQMCLIEGKKYSSVCSMINKMLKDAGVQKTLIEYLDPHRRPFHNNIKGQINDMLPDLSQ